MRDPRRIRTILDKIQDVWQANPDLRFAQVLYNIGYIELGRDPYYIEDDLLEELLDRNGSGVTQLWLMDEDREAEDEEV